MLPRPLGLSLPLLSGPVFRVPDPVRGTGLPVGVYSPPTRVLGVPWYPMKVFVLPQDKSSSLGSSASGVVFSPRGTTGLRR